MLEVYRIVSAHSAPVESQGIIQQVVSDMLLNINNGVMELPNQGLALEFLDCI